MSIPVLSQLMVEEGDDTVKVLSQGVEKYIPTKYNYAS